MRDAFDSPKKTNGDFTGKKSKRLLKLVPYGMVFALLLFVVIAMITLLVISKFNIEKLGFWKFLSNIILFIAFYTLLLCLPVLPTFILSTFSAMAKNIVVKCIIVGINLIVSIIICYFAAIIFEMLFPDFSTEGYKHATTTFGKIFTWAVFGFITALCVAASVLDIILFKKTKWQKLHD